MEVDTGVDVAVAAGIPWSRALGAANARPAWAQSEAVGVGEGDVALVSPGACVSRRKVFAVAHAISTGQVQGPNSVAAGRV